MRAWPFPPPVRAPRAPVLFGRATHCRPAAAIAVSCLPTTREGVVAVPRWCSKPRQGGGGCRATGRAGARGSAGDTRRNTARTPRRRTVTGLLSPCQTAAGGGEVPRHSGWTGARHNGDSLPGLFESHHPIPPIPCPCTRPPHIPIRMLYQIFRTATGAHAPPGLPLTSTPASPCALDEESPLPPNERVVFP